MYDCSRCRLPLSFRIIYEGLKNRQEKYRTNIECIMPFTFTHSHRHTHRHAHTHVRLFTHTRVNSLVWLWYVCSVNIWLTVCTTRDSYMELNWYLYATAGWFVRSSNIFTDANTSGKLCNTFFHPFRLASDGTKGDRLCERWWEARRECGRERDREREMCNREK